MLIPNLCTETFYRVRVLCITLLSPNSFFYVCIFYVLILSVNHNIYCTVLAVLVGLQTTPLNLSHSFIADYTRRYYNRSVANSSLTICVDHSLFLSTLLTVDYFRWSPTIHCRLSALVVSPLANYQLTLTLTSVIFLL
jgi:hypothetical protein